MIDHERFRRIDAAFKAGDLAALRAAVEEDAVEDASDFPNNPMPNQRGINDWTALMMAVIETNVEGVRLLLSRGADRSLRTRIDDYETALEIARGAAVARPDEKRAAEIVALLDEA